MSADTFSVCKDKSRVYQVYAHFCLHSTWLALITPVAPLKGPVFRCLP